jgi:hypothetical protein
MKKIVFLLFSAITVSCGKKDTHKNIIKSEQGGIDIVTNIYFNASKGLDDMKSIIVSKINYKRDTLIEIVPDIDYPEFTDKLFIISDTLAYDISDTDPKQFLFSMLKKTPAIQLQKKERGAVFSKDPLEYFDKRKDMKDTILFKKEYKRFYINTPSQLSTFYVHPTDTLLPYSFYKEEAEMYQGRIERIDFYDKEKDMFVSLQLLPRNKWDNEAKNIFEFNEFAKKRK